MTGPAEPARLYHLALEAEWQALLAQGKDYEHSTLGRSLAEQGFIHCSYAHQVQGVADFIYRDRSDVVLLTIDPNKLSAKVVVENLEGGEELFPHIYGPLPLAAVLRASPVATGADGRLELPDL
ncbi:MAG: DUF952 domain-containing protein [Acidimicrobiales bacterium]